MVPKGWRRVPIKDATESIIDCVNKTAPVVDYETPFKMIRTTNVRNGRVNTEDVRYVAKETYQQWIRRGKPQTGDIIFTREAPVGEVGVLENAEGIFLGQRTMMYRAASDRSNNYYLFYSLSSSFCQKQIEDFSNGGTVAHMRVPDCGEILINLPPLPEQKKIAQILSTWDRVISTTEQLLANSQQQKKALMQQLLTGKKRLLDAHGVQFGGEWKEYRLEELEGIGWIVLSRGKVISKEDIEKNPGTYPIYSSSIKNGGLMGTYGDFMFDEEMISWSVDGGGNFFHRPKHRFSVTNVSGYMRLDTTHLDYQFVASQLELLHSKLEFDYQFKAHPSVIRKLYRLTLPVLEEQHKIAAVLSVADQEIEVLQQKLDCLKREKKALMQQLLTGKRRVNIEGAA